MELSPIALALLNGATDTRLPMNKSGIGGTLSDMMLQQAQTQNQQVSADAERYKLNEEQRAQQMLNGMDLTDPTLPKRLMAAGEAVLAAKVMQMQAKAAPSSTIGKIQADIDAGLITPEVGAAALKKATTIAPVYDPVSGNMIYAGGNGFAQPEMGGGMGGGTPAPTVGGASDIPPEFNGNRKAYQAYLEKQASLAAERSGEKSKKEVGASNMLDLIDEARTLLPLATSGKLETKVKEIGQDVFGYSTDASQADAQLKVIGANLTSNIPRMEGPQSDKDTQMYREAASDVANTLIPAGDRMAALKTLEKIQKKYAGKGFISEQSSVQDMSDAELEAIANGE